MRYSFQRVYGDKQTAIIDARGMVKKNKRAKIKLYESPSSRYIVTNQEKPSGYREIDFENVSLTAVRVYDKEYMSEVPLEERFGYA